MSALDVNPVQGARTLSENGSSWLWAVFALFLVSFLVHALLSMIRKRSTRGPHSSVAYLSSLFTVALLAGSIAYFAMAAGLGSIAIATSSGDDLLYPSYQVFWPKYAYWAVAFPAVVIALGLLTHTSWPKILFGIGLAWAWVLSYFLSSMTRTTYKWGFFALGTVAWLRLAMLTYSMLGSSKKHQEATRAGNNNATTGAGTGSKSALGLIIWANLLWMLYPIAFGLSDGGNEIGVTSSFIFFGILDLLLLPLIAAAALFHVRKWGVPARGYNDGYSAEKTGLGTNGHHGATGTAVPGHSSAV